MKQKEIYWSRFADDFEERNNYIIGIESMQIVLTELEKETNLGNTLELACGNGTYSKVLVKNSNTLTCTDFSEQMVEASKQRLKAFDKITVQQANCFNLPFDDNTFDTIFMANLLHVLQTPEKAISEAKRVLKQGGQILAIDFTNKGMSLFAKMGMVFRYLKSYGKPPQGAIPVDDEKMKELFKQNDLDIKFAKIIGGKSKAAFGKAVKSIS